jgi:hypothetical protein
MAITQRSIVVLSSNHYPSLTVWKLYPPVKVESEHNETASWPHSSIFCVDDDVTKLEFVYGLTCVNRKQLKKTGKYKKVCTNNFPSPLDFHIRYKF